MHMLVNLLVMCYLALLKSASQQIKLCKFSMYVEYKKQDAVIEGMIKGMDLKNPKIVCGCVNACTAALKKFGSKIINVKPFVKKVPVLFADRDKAVRDEARLLVIEIYKWVGPAIK